MPAKPIDKKQMLVPRTVTNPNLGEVCKVAGEERGVGSIVS